MSNTVLKRALQHGSRRLGKLEAIGFQTVVSSLVFICIAAADIGAYALNQYPSSEWLWQFNMTFGNFFQSVLQKFDVAFGLGFAGNVLLFVLCAFLPLLIYRLRFRMVSSVVCHLAFALFLVATLSSAKGHQYAALMLSSRQFETIMINLAAEAEFAILTGLLGVLTLVCIHAHVTALVQVYRQMNLAFDWAWSRVRCGNTFKVRP